MAKPIPIWVPQEGSQKLFITCPFWEVLLEGNRGGGKTDVLIMDFLQHVGTGLGAAWRGILFRESFPQLEDIIAKCYKWIPQIFPTATYNTQKHAWTFEDGEQLLLRFMEKEEDYWNYHGHEYPWIGWEELTNWKDSKCYLSMMSCNRSSNPKCPRKYRSTCNPGGVGNQWVKKRFNIRKGTAGKVYTDEYGQTKTYIKSKLNENKILLKADPTYKAKLMTMTETDPIKRKAWIEGDWDIIAGGALTDLWDSQIHELKPFIIPKTWTVFRSFDYGSAKPWCVSYIAISNGDNPDFDEDDERQRALIPTNFIKGSAIVIDEIYGCKNGEPNVGDQATTSEIAEKIKKNDLLIERLYNVRVKPGPADTAIWEVRDGKSIAQSLIKFGVHWLRAYKGTGSRKSGLAEIRQMLSAAVKKEEPGLYFFTTAEHHIRTLTSLQRDKKDVEDVDTDQEDHAYDSLRYGLTRKKLELKRGKVRM